MDGGGREEPHYRALPGDVDGIRERLAAGGNVALADRQGCAPLHFAAKQSQAEAVKVLRDAGASVDQSLVPDLGGTADVARSHDEPLRDASEVRGCPSTSSRSPSRARGATSRCSRRA